MPLIIGKGFSQLTSSSLWESLHEEFHKFSLSLLYVTNGNRSRLQLPVSYKPRATGLSGLVWDSPDKSIKKVKLACISASPTFFLITHVSVQQCYIKSTTKISAATISIYFLLTYLQSLEVALIKAVGLGFAYYSAELGCSPALRPAVNQGLDWIVLSQLALGRFPVCSMCSHFSGASRIFLLMETGEVRER